MRNRPPLDPRQEVVVVVDDYGQYRLDHTPPEALVVHCGDPRFQRAFHQFLTEELGLKNYVPIVIGGGIHALGAQVFLPKNFRVLYQQVKFFVKEKKLTRVVFINHEDCQWYAKMQGYHPTIPLSLKGQLDLKQVAQLVAENFGVQVESYYAHLEGESITFEKTD